MEEWEPIEDFPGYSVSSLGRIRNDRFGRVMALTRNQRGLVMVGLLRDKVQHKRSVALLVAKAFLPEPVEPHDTPIQIDGDRTNACVENMMWRPRWFAARYHAQFIHSELHYNVPIREKKTGRIYANAFEAAVAHGLLEKQIAIAIINCTYVFPTYQVFEEVDIN